MVEMRPTALDGVVELEPRRFADSRGWFRETWNQSALADHAILIDWVQDNESFSALQGTIRGIHLQTSPFAQDKLVRCVQGTILDIAVDLRADSPTFGSWVAVELSDEQGNQLLVPRGFGHAFCTLSPNCLVSYKVSAMYAPDCDVAIAWNDPTLAIDWPVPEAQVTLSEKDAAAPLLADVGTLAWEVDT